jgi:hypothetical protein
MQQQQGRPFKETTNLAIIGSELFNNLPIHLIRIHRLYRLHCAA